jgi:release factor glutamine methyltransferase
MPTVEAGLQWARPQMGLAQARLLLCHVMGCTPTFLVAHPESPVAAEAMSDFQTAVAQRVAGVPLAYLLGSREFYGRAFAIGEGALIPRPETEHLVDEALDCLRSKTTSTVLDMGTGSGCVAITLALEAQAQGITTQVWASDVSEMALNWAIHNAQALKAPVRFLRGSWFEALKNPQNPMPMHHPVPALFDLIVSNPPYIADQDPHLGEGDLRFEPQSALASGPEGRDALRELMDQAPCHLAPGGFLIVEHGFDQASWVRSALHARGFRGVFSRRDLAGIERITGGCYGGIASVVRAT